MVDLDVKKYNYLWVVQPHLFDRLGVKISRRDFFLLDTFSSRFLKQSWGFLLF